MAQLKISRTLVKSRPELWAECSDAASLARHLGAFGELQITKLEPETAVAWEGEDVCGTVTLEPSGWGTRVVLTATVEGVGEPAFEFGPEPAEPAAAADSEPALEPSPGFFRRLLGGWRRAPDPALDPEPASEVHAAVEPDSVEPSPVAAEPPGAHDTGPDSHRAGALVSALDSLGKAHRRPFTHG